MAIEIKTADKKITSISFQFVEQSFLMQNIISKTKIKEPILIKVEYEIIILINEFIKNNVQKPEKDSDAIELTKKLSTFYSGLSKKQLGDLIAAANYLDMPVLLESMSKYIAYLIQDGERDYNELVGGNVCDNLDEVSFEHIYGWMSSEESE